jgi:NAD(P)-dependent dehydrogenase (short-subunit alcohol dehydrogenase family)
MTTAAPDISGKVYIVTGASRGVGLAISRVLQARGARFAMLARTEAELEQHAAQFGKQALAVACDVTDRARAFTAVAQVAEHFGAIDGLINNAGLGRIAPVERIKEDEFAQMFRVNVQGPLNLIQAVLPHLRAQGGGNIVNIGSASVRHTEEFPYTGAYASMKAALERLTVELRIEVSDDNIAVTLFSLGSTMTHFSAGWEPELAAEAFAEWIRRGGPAPATMDPALPAEAIVRCLESPASACADFIQFRPYASMPKGGVVAQ